MARRRRRRSVYIGLIPVVVLMALGTRRYAEPLPDVVSRYGGDTLWALGAFLLFGALLASLSTAALAVLTFVASCLGEVSQFYHAPWIDSLRDTFVGGIILGHGFLWSDLVCYLVGVVMGVLLEIIVLRKVAVVGGSQAAWWTSGRAR